MSISHNNEIGKSVLILLLPALGLIFIAGLVMLSKAKAKQTAVFVSQIQMSTAVQSVQNIATTTVAIKPSQIKEVKAYVASKTGAAYYLPVCASVKRIAEKNKIWFNSKEEAEKAGYTAAKNCKEMK